MAKRSAANYIKTEILGIKEVQRRLTAIRLVKGPRAVREVITKHSRRVRQIARSVEKTDVRQRTGMLYKSLNYKVKSYRRKQLVVGMVGAKANFSKLIGTKADGTKIEIRPTRYLHLVEKGTYRSRAFPFLAPAMKMYTPQILPNTIAWIKSILMRP